jgi:hypothetical protein
MTLKQARRICRRNARLESLANMHPANSSMVLFDQLT